MANIDSVLLTTFWTTVLLLVSITPLVMLVLKGNESTASGAFMVRGDFLYVGLSFSP